jgi:hypothetical protein
MKNIHLFFADLVMIFFLSLIIAAGIVTAQKQVEQDVVTPAHHPQEILTKFHHHLRCPYANEWITQGPYQAAINLGIVLPGSNKKHKQAMEFTTTIATTSNGMMRRGGGVAHRRKRRTLQDEEDDTLTIGHCTFTNAWTVQPTCIEFRGDYSIEEMLKRCSSEADSNLVIKERDNSSIGCMTTTVVVDSSSSVVGWCYVQVSDTALEAMTMMGDCTQNQMACETFMSGTFQPINGSCNETNSTSGTTETQPGTTTTTTNQTQSSNQPVTCQIAPGKVKCATCNSPKRG